MGKDDGTVADGPEDQGIQGVPGRRRRAVVAGHDGDERTARSLLADEDAAVRTAALGALDRMDAVTAADLVAAMGDPHPAVRRRAAAAAIGCDGAPLLHLLDDPDHSVVEQAAWASGERAAPESGTVERLAALATDHDDALCREAAVAALGAIGDATGLPAILRATGDRATVRRRAVIALAPFEGPEVDAALERALSDRDWQVRQAAEDQLEPPPA